MADLEKLVEELSKLSVLEAAELVKALEEKWGVSAAAAVAVAADPPRVALLPLNLWKRRPNSMSSSRTPAPRRSKSSRSSASSPTSVSWKPRKWPKPPDPRFSPQSAKTLQPMARANSKPPVALLRWPKQQVKSNKKNQGYP